MSINCLCGFTSHYNLSTNEEDNLVKEFSFKNSKLFGQGVPEEGFATSSAILIKRDLETDPQSIIKINLISDSGKEKQGTTFYEFTPTEIEKIAPKYFQLADLATDFVESVYKNNYQEAYKLVSIDADQNRFNSIVTEIKSGLENDYVDTRIVSFEEYNGGYRVYGGVYTENEVLDLFVMHFKDTGSGLKIVGFEF